MTPQQHRHVVGRIRYMRIMGEPIEQQERLAKAYAIETGASWWELLSAAQKPGEVDRGPVKQE